MPECSHPNLVLFRDTRHIDLVQKGWSTRHLGRIVFAPYFWLLRLSGLVLSRHLLHESSVGCDLQGPIYGI
jgi:hypothetical protein